VSSSETTPAVASMFRPVLRKISTSGRSSRNMMVPSLGAERNSDSTEPCGASRMSGTGTWMRRPRNLPKR
jgi:hypothetical protein